MKRTLSMMLSMMLSLMLLILPALACAESSKPVIEPVIPMPAQLINAVLADEGAADSPIIYKGATEEDLQYYLVAASFVGAYAIDISEDGYPIYLLFTPGTAAVARVLFIKENEMLAISVNGEYSRASNVVLNRHLAYLEKDLKLPSGKGENIMPQFYTCVGRNPFYQAVMEIDSVFDGRRCWVECYDGIDMTRMSAYTTFMAAFGFDVSVDSVMTDSDDIPYLVYLLYTNGDAEILVQYNATEQSAFVFYEPGVSYYLLSGSELLEALGE